MNLWTIGLVVTLAASACTASHAATVPVSDPVLVPPSPSYGLFVSGNRLVNGLGQTVILHGVNVPSGEWACAQKLGFFQEPVDQAGVAAIAAWHANAVRVALNEDCWLGINGVPAAWSGENYINAVANYVKLLNANGIYAILSLQAAAPGTNLAAAVGAPQAPMPDRDHAPAFWASVASRFGGNHDVLFDLYNEPAPDSNHDSNAAWTCWRDGGTCPGVTYAGASYKAAGMQELVTKVRTAGAANILLLGGTNFAYKFDQWLAKEPVDPDHALVASFHTYFDSCPLSNRSPRSVSPAKCYSSLMATVGSHVPVITGEVGEGDCTDTQVVRYMDWADSAGVSYLGWGWDPYGCGFPALITSYDGSPSAMGLGFERHYQATFPPNPPITASKAGPG